MVKIDAAPASSFALSMNCVLFLFLQIMVTPFMRNQPCEEGAISYFSFCCLNFRKDQPLVCSPSCDEPKASMLQLPKTQDRALKLAKDVHENCVGVRNNVTTLNDRVRRSHCRDKT